MGDKRQRQATILRIVTGGAVASQSEMQRALRKQRMRVTQSTLSRDLAELGIRKVRGRYVANEREGVSGGGADHSAAVRRFATCGPNLIVVATATGEAQPVALTIDEADDPSIAGTLAGDDTILVATRSRRTQTVALRRLAQWFGEKHEH